MYDVSGICYLYIRTEFHSIHIMSQTHEIPAHMKAAVTLGNTKVALKSDVPVPKPGPGQILVKVIAAAQNPPDGEFCVISMSTSS